jgi:hypothetical protein
MKAHLTIGYLVVVTNRGQLRANLGLDPPRIAVNGLALTPGSYHLSPCYFVSSSYDLLLFIATPLPFNHGLL